MSKVYERPGCHAVATKEEAIARAMRSGCPVAIMECAHETPYDTGWHRITMDAVSHWQRQGYILRAVVELTVRDIP